MKVLILVSFALAVASAGWTPVPYHGPQHIPVIHDGVPVETPEVQHARQYHLSALAEASAKAEPYVEPQHEELHYAQPKQEYNNYNSGYDSNSVHQYSVQHIQHEAAPVHHVEPVHYAPVHHASPLQHATAPAYETSHVYPSIGHDGKPLDTPEVEAAKAHHFQAFNEALSRVKSHGPQHQNVESHYRKRRSLYASHYQHIPVIGHNGVPVEPFEVQHARAEHLAAHALASSGHSYGQIGHASEGVYSSDLGHGVSGYSIHQKHAPVYGHHDSYTHFIPVIDYHGRPLDTPEVEYLKAKHFQAHHEAASRSSHYGSGYGYGLQVPVDTIEVQHAKAEHFAAHAAAKAYHY